MWVLDYLDDLDADFRVFYRFPSDPSGPGVADEYFGNLTSPRFFLLAERTFAYQGAMAARAMAEKDKQERPTRQKHAASARAHSTGKQHISLEQLMLLDPSLIQYERG